MKQVSPLWSSLKYKRVLHQNYHRTNLVSLVLHVQDSLSHYALKLYPNRHPNKEIFNPSFLMDVAMMKRFEGHPRFLSCVSYKLGSEVFPLFDPLLYQNILQLVQKKKKKKSNDQAIQHIFQMGFSLLPFCVNKDLDTYLEKCNPPFTTRYQFAQDIIEGIAVFHDNNYVLQDLKPANLFVVMEGKDLRIKFSDFEDCALIEKQGYKFSRGTEGYMAPERIVRCLPLNKSLDIWSLGKCLYELFECGSLLETTSISRSSSSSSSSSNKRKMELLQCFDLIPENERLKVWTKWTQKYLPEMCFVERGKKEDFIVKANMEHMTMSSK